MFDIAEALWKLLINPNVAYLLLIVGVWCVVMAASIPGTGLPEGAAVLCLALAAVGLVKMQASLAGLGLIGLALILFILEFRFMAHGAFLLGGLVAMLVGSVLLFRAESTPDSVLSWGLVVMVNLLFAAGFSGAVYVGWKARNLPVLQDPNRVVGMLGVAQTKINSQGAVYAAGEEWSAYADEEIPQGAPVRVVAREGLRLKVAQAGQTGAA